MTLVDYVVTLRRHWIVIVALTLLGGLVGYAVEANAQTTYRSSTSALVTSEIGRSASDLVQGSTYVEKLVSSYVLLTTSERVLQPVIDELDLKTTPKSLARSITVESPVNTVLINVNVDGPDPVRTADVANAVTDSLSDAVADVSSTEPGRPAIRLTTMQSADVPTIPVGPNPLRWALLAAMVGLVLGVGLALVRRTFGSAMNDAADVAAVTDVPVVGEIVDAKRGTTLPSNVLEDTRGVQAESVRGLAANLSFLGVDDGLRSLVVTSASAGESKSSIAAALALVLAESPQRVLLIDADLRAPSLHVLTGLDNTLGLSTVLIGDDSLEVSAQPWGRERLDVLTSGPLPPNPGQLVSSDSMRALIARAEESYDVVVVDSAPLLSVVDALWLGHMVDGVLLIARRGKTKPRALLKAVETLTSANTRVSGIVLSRVARGTRAGYGHAVTGSGVTQA